MAGEPVQGWDQAALVVSEATFGTTVAPATAQAIEVITVDTGPSGVGDVRGKKDRGVGRGMQSAFVEGRQKPIPFSIEAAQKTRASATTVPIEDAIYRAAGLTRTVGGGNVVYSTPAAPSQTALSFAGLSLYRALGKPPYVYEAEQLRGGVIKSLSWNGGASELMLKAAGEAIDKYHLGYINSITVLIGATTLTVTGEDIYRLGNGYYQCESEVILVANTGTSYTDGIWNITRAQVATAAAAHTAQPLVPYLPTLTYAGTPIAEGGTVTVTVDGVTFRAMSFNVDLTTGADMLPGESGSKYVQGPKFLRYDVKAGAKLVLAREQVALLGKARARNTCAVTLVQSTGAAGGIVTHSIPYCEVLPQKVPAPPNDVSIIDVAFRVRDSAGNDAWSMTLT